MSTPKKRKAAIPVRRLPKQWRAPVRAFSIAVGELVWASNFSHSAFANVFAVMISKANLQIGYAVWHTIQSDKGQLEALTSAATAALPPKSRVLKNILWAKRKADDLAVLRNDAAHMSTAFKTGNTPFELIANPLNNTPKRLARLEKETDIIKTFRAVKGDLYQLGMYVHGLFCYLAYPSEHDPMPRRPQLKTVPRTRRSKSSQHKVPPAASAKE